MNTVEQGDSFEDEAYNIICSAIKEGQLGIIEQFCKVYKKKKYYSQRREKDIIFDIVIEVWPPNATNYSLLYIIECKSYTHTVPVDDVEEFWAKIQQVAGVNVKGVIMTTNTFQKSGFNVAKSLGMMLIEVDCDLSYNIRLYNSNAISIGKTSFSLSSTINWQHEYLDRQIQQHLNEFIYNSFNHQAISEESKHVRGLKKLSSLQIENIVNSLLNEFNEYILSKHIPTRVDEYITYFSKKYNVEVILDQYLERNTNGENVLGYYNYKENAIFINKRIVELEPYNFPFIFAHELGHYFLHRNLKMNQKFYDSLKDSKYSFNDNKHVLENEKHWIEWQANKFAASFLMPKESIIYHLLSYQTKNGIRNKGIIYLDHQPINHQLFHDTLVHLAKHFNVNKKNIEYRLKELSIILNSNEEINASSFLE